MPSAGKLKEVEILKELKELALFTRLLKAPENELVKKAAADGRKVIGYNCSMIPTPLLSAGGLVPVWLRSPETADTETANFYMSPFNCSYSRAMLQSIIEGRFDFVDGLVFAESCVHIDRVLHNLEVSGFHSPLKDKPHYMLPFPRKELPAYLDTLVDDLRILSGKLSENFGVEINDDSLRETIRARNEMNALLKRIADFRLENEPRITGTEWHTIFAACQTAPADMLIEPLTALLDELGTREPDADGKPRIMVFGSDLDDPALTALIERQGCRVVADRYCFGSLPGLEPIPEDGDPYSALAEHFLHNTQCPRMIERSDDRLDYMLQVAGEYRVDGIIFEVMKFCDLWGWEVLKNEAAAKDAGIPTLKLEREYAYTGEGQLRTRVQAFVERLNGVNAEEEARL